MSYALQIPVQVPMWLEYAHLIPFLVGVIGIAFTLVLGVCCFV